MAYERDYGAVEGRPIPTNTYEEVKRSQVWLATHGGDDILLPHRYRSFISFSFGGKFIEDFDLIAYCKGDTMSRKGSADFADLTTEYDIMDGQYYHGTHFKPNTLSLDLVTDGIDLLKLDEFLSWFRGGMTRELILAEHPNRAIMARVSDPPILELLPFEKKITITINGIDYTSSTTLYRGTIGLNFVSDTSFWYAKLNILIYGEINEGLLSTEQLLPSNDVFKEAIKVIYEDTVPMNSMIQTTMHFGGSLYANVSNNIYTLIAGPVDSADPTVLPPDWAMMSSIPGYFTTTVNGVTEYWCGARINGGSYLGYTSGAFMTEENTSLTGPIVRGDTSYEIFYGGTAPSPVTISFKVPIVPMNSTYINCFANSYYKYNNKDYSTITVESVHKKEFSFTLPNILLSWNKAYELFNSIVLDNLTNPTNLKDLTDTIRDLIRHPIIRQWAIAIISYMSLHSEMMTESGTFTSTGKSNALNYLTLIFLKNGTWSNAEFTFNSELGTAIGKFSYWKAKSSNVNPVSSLINSSTAQVTWVTEEENVGDMLRSNWLFLEDHNKLVDNLYVSSWRTTSPTNAHRVSHDLPYTAIEDLKFTYKNMYL